LAFDLATEFADGIFEVLYIGQAVLHALFALLNALNQRSSFARLQLSLALLSAATLAVALLLDLDAFQLLQIIGSALKTPFF
jgi:hypothetical protein